MIASILTNFGILTHKLQPRRVAGHSTAIRSVSIRPEAMRFDPNPHSGARRGLGMPSERRDTGKFAEPESGAAPYAQSEEACSIDALRPPKSAVSYPQHGVPLAVANTQRHHPGFCHCQSNLASPLPCSRDRRPLSLAWSPNFPLERVPKTWSCGVAVRRGRAFACAGKGIADAALGLNQFLRKVSIDLAP